MPPFAKAHISVTFTIFSGFMGNSVQLSYFTFGWFRSTVTKAKGAKGPPNLLQPLETRLLIAIQYNGYLYCELNEGTYQVQELLFSDSPS